MDHASNGAANRATPAQGASAAPSPPMKVSEALGEIVWLMSQSAFHKQIFISDLEGMVMPPVLLGQFRLFHQPVEQPTSMPGAAATPGGTAQRPIGVVLWAQVDTEVEARLAAGGVRMRPQDWRSGDKLWVVEVIAPFGGHEAMVQDLKDKVFPARPISFVKLGVDGTKEVAVV